jgi:antirestriction protein
MSRTVGKSIRKAKKSFTLSVESVAFLEEMRQKSSTESTSAILEEILQAARREEKRIETDRAITEYYNSLSDEEAAEERQWGEFARRAFANDEERR